MASGSSFLIALVIGLAIFGYFYFSALYIEKNLWWIALGFFCMIIFLMKDASVGKKEIIKTAKYDNKRKIDFW